MFPANDLERALVTALADPAAFARFLELLAASEVILPLFRRGGPELDPATFCVVEHEGHEGVAAYTSAHELARATRGTTPCVRMTGARLAEGWDEGTKLLLNPGGTLGTALDAPTVIALAGQERT